MFFLFLWKCHWNFGDDALNQEMALVSIDILIVLFLLIQEQRVSFLLCLHYLLSKSHHFQYKDILPPWLNLLLSIIGFDIIVNRTVLFLLDISLLVNGNTTDFCRLIFHLATLLNPLISSNIYLVGYLGFLVYKMMLPANKDNFTSFKCLLILPDFSG